MLVRFAWISLVLCCAAAAAPRTVTGKRQHSHTTQRRLPPTFSIEKVNDAATSDVVRPHDKGSAVLRAQILLDRAHFSVGEIDGAFGDNMTSALRAYQGAKGLPSTGKVDAATWTALNADKAPAIVAYTIADTDAAGPFETVPSDLLEAAKLSSLGYESMAEELGERFHINPALLQKLNPGKMLDQPGQEIQVPGVTRGAAEEKAAKIVVREADHCAELLDDAGRVIAHYPATMGSEHDPLPVGEWKIHKPLQNPVFYYNSDLFWDAEQSHAKAKIAAGPNNPVGVVWIGLSKEHYGIHGTPEPSQIGKTQSHGCIRLTNWDAEELSLLVTPGMIAELRKE